MTLPNLTHLACARLIRWWIGSLPLEGGVRGLSRIAVGCLIPLYSFVAWGLPEGDHIALFVKYQCQLNAADGCGLARPGLESWMHVMTV